MARSEITTWHGIELDTSDRKAVMEFIDHTFDGERRARLAMHFAMSFAVFHAQEHGDPCYINRIGEKMVTEYGDSKGAQARRTAAQKWFHAVSRVITIIAATETTHEMKTTFQWLKGDLGKMVVVAKSESRRKGTKTLQDYLDGPTAAELLETAAAKGFSLTAFYARFAKIDEQLVNKLTEAGEQVPMDLLAAAQVFAAKAAQYRIAAEADATAVKTAAAQKVLAGNNNEPASEEAGAIAS